mmetsp:Transcript_11267/g.20382  ORF Transcript_11267/g.20382 Transcript_11267/m.20382 type:complete len:244 (-) Transcript_11267:565-1296(-)
MFRASHANLARKLVSMDLPIPSNTISSRSGLIAFGSTSADSSGETRDKSMTGKPFPELTTRNRPDSAAFRKIPFGLFSSSSLGLIFSSLVFISSAAKISGRRCFNSLAVMSLMEGSSFAAMTTSMFNFNNSLAKGIIPSRTSGPALSTKSTALSYLAVLWSLCTTRSRSRKRSRSSISQGRGWSLSRVWAKSDFVGFSFIMEAVRSASLLLATQRGAEPSIWLSVIILFSLFVLLLVAFRPPS